MGLAEPAAYPGQPLCLPFSSVAPRIKMGIMRLIGHLDMDAFFAAIEERDSPELKGRPPLAGADPAGGEGRGWSPPPTTRPGNTASTPPCPSPAPGSFRRRPAAGVRPGSLRPGELPEVFGSLPAHHGDVRHHDPRVEEAASTGLLRPEFRRFRDAAVAICRETRRNPVPGAAHG